MRHLTPDAIRMLKARSPHIGTTESGKIIEHVSHIPANPRSKEGKRAFNDAHEGWHARHVHWDDGDHADAAGVAARQAQKLDHDPERQTYLFDVASLHQAAQDAKYLKRQGHIYDYPEAREMQRKQHQQAARSSIHGRQMDLPDMPGGKRPPFAPIYRRHKRFNHWLVEHAGRPRRQSAGYAYNTDEHNHIRIADFHDQLAAMARHRGVAKPRVVAYHNAMGDAHRLQGMGLDKYEDTAHLKRHQERAHEHWKEAGKHHKAALEHHQNNPSWHLITRYGSAASKEPSW